MEAIEELRALHNGCSPSCITTSCRGAGDVTLRLPQQGALCIGCDHCTCFPEGEGQKRPDFVVLYCPGGTKAPSWYIIEMKGKRPNTEDVVRQIQAGATVVETSPCFKVTGRPCLSLVAIVVYNRGLRVADFLRKRINFFGKECPKVVKRSGDCLL